MSAKGQSRAPFAKRKQIVFKAGVWQYLLLLSLAVCTVTCTP
jgi:hypothetical protein